MNLVETVFRARLRTLFLILIIEECSSNFFIVVPYLECMLILEYLGYVALYGYAVFGLLYLVSKIFPVKYISSVYTIADYTPPLETQIKTYLVSIFSEIKIKQID